MDKFLLGSATAAHQVEGNNINSDFWHQEHMKNTRFKEPSNKAVDHYNRYKEDIDLLKQANLNAYRFSIEWARIEPKKGKFDNNEIEHYRDVLNYCISNRITPIVTMHHFSSPKWLISEGGWESTKVIEYFTNYCAYVVNELGDLLEYICTINEANMGIQISSKIKKYIGMKEGSIQVGLSNKLLNNEQEKEELMTVFGVDKANTFLSPRSIESDEIVCLAHQKARKVMKEINNNLKIGLTLSLHDFQSEDNNNKFVNEEWELEFQRYIKYIKNDEFLGLQNYTRKIFDETGELPVPSNSKRTQMGYECYPQALENVIKKVAKEIDIPIMVTENGIATSNDKERVEFITEALNGLKRCQDYGINILGYMYWSLLDNFEWQKGFEYTFGLIEVNRNTFERIPKPSLYCLAKLI